MFELFKTFDKRCKALGLVVEFEDLIAPPDEASEKQKIVNQIMQQCIRDLEEMVEQGQCSLPPLAGQPRDSE